ncbi:MAG: signal peptide peptidase SppA [Cyanobacteria bacterium P01_F01_bin.150]
MRDFLKYVFASCVALFLAAGVGISLLIALMTAIAVSGGETESDIAANSILTLDLSVPITDTPPTVTPDQIIGDVISGRPVNTPVSLRMVLDTLEAGARDDRIVGLYIEGAGSSGFATLREVRQGIETFKASNKPVIAYESSWNERAYYLISSADEILLNPSGVLELNGFSSESMFFAGALAKYGIGVSAIRAGQYKSAVEPFTRSDRSPEEKAQAEELLGELWDEFVETASSSRELTANAFQSIVNTQGLLLPQEAAAAGLIDGIAYDDEVISKLHELTKEDADESSFRQVSIKDYAQDLDLDGNDGGFGGFDPKVAVVYAEGSIVNGEGETGQIGGDRFARIIREIRLDKDIEAVVLRVNSPGGSASAADRITREIQLITDKPVIVSMGNLAASGGYLIATHSDRIFAAPNTITGSIGVFGLFPNFQDIANRNGITWDVVKTGEYADIGTISRPPSTEELAIAQRFVDQVYDDFLSNVVDSRPLSRKELEPIAQGRVWSGIKAQSLGLVDEMGGLEDAIAAAATEAGLGDKWEIEEYPKSLNFEEELLRQLFSSKIRANLTRSLISSRMPANPKHLMTSQTQGSGLDPVSDQWQRLKVELEMVRSLNDPRGVYTRLPINYAID